MNKIEQLINEYASITGRPVATLSVSEYLEIKRYSETALNMNALPSDIPVASRVVVSSIDTMEEVPASDVQPKPAKEASVTEMHPASEHKQERTVKLEPVEKKPKKSSAFAMMRSISG